MELVAIGAVESPLTERAAAPKQADESAPEAWLAFDAAYAAGLDGLAAGDDLLLLTWLDRAHRDGTRVRVDALEALDGTPIVDVKPVLRDER